MFVGHGAPTDHKIVVSYSDDCWASFPLLNCWALSHFPDQILLHRAHKAQSYSQKSDGADCRGEGSWWCWWAKGIGYQRGSNQTLPAGTSQAEKAAEFAYSQASWKLRCDPLEYFIDVWHYCIRMASQIGLGEDKWNHAAKVWLWFAMLKPK